MALVHADFVEETTTTTGTGTLDLAGATAGHRTFVSSIGDGNTCIYAIAASDGNFEAGVGLVTDASPDTLERTEFLSSTTGSVLDLPAGTHRVYCTWAAEGGEKAYSAVQNPLENNLLVPADKRIDFTTADASSTSFVLEQREDGSGIALRTADGADAIDGGPPEIELRWEEIRLKGPRVVVPSLIRTPELYGGPPSPSQASAAWVSGDGALVVGTSALSGTGMGPILVSQDADLGMGIGAGDWVDLDTGYITASNLHEGQVWNVPTTFVCTASGSAGGVIAVSVEYGDAPLLLNHAYTSTVYIPRDNSTSITVICTLPIEADSLDPEEYFPIYVSFRRVVGDNEDFHPVVQGVSFPVELYITYPAYLPNVLQPGQVFVGSDNGIPYPRSLFDDTQGVLSVSSTEPADLGVSEYPARLDHRHDFELEVGTSLDWQSGTISNPAMTAGFVNRTDTTLSFASNTVSLTKVNDYRVWVNSFARDYDATLTEGIADTTGFYYIYFDATGDFVNSTSGWDISGGGTPCATLYYNATHPTEYILSDERHSYLRNPTAHKEMHYAIGAYWISGLVGTFGDTNGSLSVTAGSYADEDIVLAFTGTTTQAKVVYRDASGWRVDALTSDIRKLNSGVIRYDNAGTLTDVAATAGGYYVNYWVYATNEVVGAADSVGTIHVLVGQQQHANTTAALAETVDNLTLPPWLSNEGRLLYRITYRRTAGVPGGDIYLTPTDFRRVKISGGSTLTGNVLSPTLGDGQIFVGSAAGTATPVDMSGGATIDNTGAVTIAKQMSVTSDASGLKLSGDSSTPGNTKLYGTDGSGTKGWYAQPAAALTHSAQTITTADVTGAVNTHYLCTIAGLTADRYLTLPAGAAGDRVRISIVDVDDTYKLGIKGATDITINGGSAATLDRWLQTKGNFVEYEATSATNWQQIGGANLESIILTIGTFVSPIWVGTGKVSLMMPYPFHLVDIMGAVSTAPTGAAIIMDVNLGGTSVMTTNKILIDATEFSTLTASTPPAITTDFLPKGGVITADIDQAGSTVAGVGPIVYLIGRRA
jgi:hypothetical protein